MPSDLFTTSYLGSYVGLTAATYLLVQFFKEPMKKYLGDWWIRLLAVVVAVLIQSFTLYVSGNFTVETFGLAILNAFLIAITAAGAHNISQNSTSINNVSPTSTPIPTSIPMYYNSIINASQVPDVSPPINTPQSTGDDSDDPKAILPTA